jgi:ABC-type uncharacterized transport system fused permease/ATPase subunit
MGLSGLLVFGLVVICLLVYLFIGSLAKFLLQEPIKPINHQTNKPKTNKPPN